MKLTSLAKAFYQKNETLWGFVFFDVKERKIAMRIL